MARKQNEGAIILVKGNGKRRSGHDKPLNLSGEQLDRKTEACLAKGPKFCVNVKPSRVDIVSGVFEIARKIFDQDKKKLFIDDAMRKVSRLVDRFFLTDRVNCKVFTNVKKELEQKALTLLQTDKSGRFVVLENDMFGAKASEAVSRLFKPFVKDLKKFKRKVVAILQECVFPTVVKKLGEISQATLRLKFLLKDHKAGFPLKVVVNENGAWQKVLSVIIQKCLAGVEVNSPSSLNNYEQLIEVWEDRDKRRLSWLMP